MFTGTTSHSGALVTTIVVLTGAAILRGGAAVADSNQDDQFLTLLDEKGIPALENVPSLIDTAHNVCRKLDAGMPADGLVNAMVNQAYGIDSTERLYPPGRLARTEARFITAAVEAYCPHDQSKIASIMANPALASNESTHHGAAHTHNAVNSGSDLQEPPSALDMINMSAASQQPTGIGAVRLPHLMDAGVFASGRYGGNRSDCDAHGPALASLIGPVPSGEATQPNPPQIPPPAAQMQTPHRPMAAPPPPQQPPPRPKQPPPPPQQVEPPGVGPQPGGAAGSGGGDSTGGNGGGSTGGNGGGGQAEPPPAPSMPPGFVRLAP